MIANIFRPRLADWLVRLVDADSVRYDQAAARAKPLVVGDPGEPVSRPAPASGARGSAR